MTRRNWIAIHAEVIQKRQCGLTSAVQLCEIECNLNYRQVCLDDGVHFIHHLLRVVSAQSELN